MDFWNAGTGAIKLMMDLAITHIVNMVKNIMMRTKNKITFQVL